MHAFFMIIMILVAIYVYFPLTAIFGGWDDASLKEFRKVVKISGPSKFIVTGMYKMLKKLCKMSPLHNKFPLDDEAALRESRELDIIKEESREDMNL